MARKKRRKKRKVVTKRRKRRRKALPLYVLPKIRRKRRKKRKNPLMAVNPKRKKRRRRRKYLVGRGTFRVPVRRGRRRAYVRTNPFKDVLNQTLWLAVGLVGNNIASGLLSSFLGGTLPFMQKKVVPSAVVSVLAYTFLRKQNPTIVAGSVLNTALEGVKVILPEDIKVILGFSEMPLALPAPEEELEGFNPSDPDVGVNPFPVQDTFEGFDPSSNVFGELITDEEIDF